MLDIGGAKIQFRDGESYQIVQHQFYRGLSGSHDSYFLDISILSPQDPSVPIRRGKLRITSEVLEFLPGETEAEQSAEVLDGLKRWTQQNELHDGFFLHVDADGNGVQLVLAELTEKW
jgi:hypothetical protein